MNKQDIWALFWAKEPTEQDFRNRALSRVDTIMLTYSLAKFTPLILQIRQHGAFDLVIAIEQDNQDSPTTILATLNHIASWTGKERIKAIIVGREPDAPYMLHDRSPNWGLEAAWRHFSRFEVLRENLQHAGYRVVSPGLALKVMLPNGHIGRSISEDDTPAPGVTSWRNICTTEGRGWNAAEGAGWHIYQYGMSTYIDVARVKMEWRRACELMHKPIWVDEVGVLLPSNVAQMEAYIQIYQILRAHQSGYRLELFCPFISTGYDNSGAWPPGYLLRDPAAYELLGRFIQEP